jgi:3-oxosteroid 1-dehydrogenase
LEATVRAHNRHAAAGIDPDFGKGESAYDRAYGDPDHAPNPCLGPIDRPPYCAVAVWPTPLGTSLGIRANADAQALDAGGRPLPGLYVCGNDMHTITAGEYPGSGAQIGVAMVFGYLAARHAAGTRASADP